jgi:hypothetical protein
MQLPRDDAKGRDSRYFVAAEDVGRYAEAAGPALEQAIGVEWYTQHGSEVDRAALALCRLRRARAGEKGEPRSGDEAVRLALTEASPTAVVWIASRAISYMDESGFPEAVEPWFPEESAPAP